MRERLSFVYNLNALDTLWTVVCWGAAGACTGACICTGAGDCGFSHDVSLVTELCQYGRPVASVYRIHAAGWGAMGIGAMGIGAMGGPALGSSLGPGSRDASGSFFFMSAREELIAVTLPILRPRAKQDFVR